MQQRNGNYYFFLLKTNNWIQINKMITQEYNWFIIYFA
jgi:hypothetical protein